MSDGKGQKIHDDEEKEEKGAVHVLPVGLNP